MDREDLTVSLDDETSGIFIDTYCRFQEEIWALGPRPGRYEHKTDSTATAEEIDRAIQDKFERSRQILEIREKYYEEYSRLTDDGQAVTQEREHSGEKTGTASKIAQA